jgi:hypothetical protein
MPLFLQPAFFDIFGAVAFLFITLSALYALWYRQLPSQVYWVLLAIGVVGLVVDAVIVYTHFLA